MPAPSSVAWRDSSRSNSSNTARVILNEVKDLGSERAVAGHEILRLRAQDDTSSFRRTERLRLGQLAKRGHDAILDSHVRISRHADECAVRLGRGVSQ
jgi:hypothetical protein